MVTITVDDISVSGETEKLAMKALAKAKRERSAKSKVDSANRDMAYMRAQASGFNMLNRKLGEAKPMPPGWRQVPVPHRGLMERVGEVYERTWKIVGIESTAIHEFYDAPQYAIENGAGHPIGLVFHDGVYALGISEDQAAIVKVPGIVADDFRMTRLPE